MKLTETDKKVIQNKELADFIGHSNQSMENYNLQVQGDNCESLSIIGEIVQSIITHSTEVRAQHETTEFDSSYLINNEYYKMYRAKLIRKNEANMNKVKNIKSSFIKLTQLADSLGLTIEEVIDLKI